ncbi:MULTISPECIES: hypothetical protein [unclassified Streptomyces]|uniref:hypothetical protein n=1 Tax=unclassified Streptomyces TaxID=2593676 RepID=UPI002DDAA068|nr:hypothetical protein [Streptomyces sp. NBC_01750]WSB01508.1 hypothetical protein OIE54_20695 [Streptomyces sp. NBC_01794]WSD34164.1 hypothetical protein OG966_21080 [Streptomyces sp. NBC_01750]
MTDSLIAACCAAVFALLLTSVLGLARAGGSDPSAEARSVTLAVYGAVVAVVTLGLLIILA